jgi:hypothetical protein
MSGGDYTLEAMRTQGRWRRRASLKVERFSIVCTEAPIGVRDKEGVNRALMTRTGADHLGYNYKKSVSIRRNPRHQPSINPPPM